MEGVPVPMKVRVWELAKSIDTESQTLLGLLNEWGHFIRSASSTVEPAVAQRVRDYAAAHPLPGSTTPHAPEAPGPTQPLRRGPTAGHDHVHYAKTRLEDGTKFSDAQEPADGILHAIRDRDRRPLPFKPVFLDYNGAEPRRAWCGAQIKIVLPEYFDADAERACPECIAALNSPTELVWSTG